VKANDEVHQDDHEIVMPAGGLLTPEAGVPDENFFLDGAEHDEDETESGELGEDSEGDAQAAGDFGDAEEDGEGLGHPDAFWRGPVGSLRWE